MRGRLGQAASTLMSYITSTFPRAFTLTNLHLHFMLFIISYCLQMLPKLHKILGGKRRPTIIQCTMYLFFLPNLINYMQMSPLSFLIIDKYHYLTFSKPVTDHHWQ